SWSREEARGQLARMTPPRLGTDPFSDTRHPGDYAHERRKPGTLREYPAAPQSRPDDCLLPSPSMPFEAGAGLSAALGSEEDPRKRSPLEPSWVERTLAGTDLLQTFHRVASLELRGKHQLESAPRPALPTKEASTWRPSDRRTASLSSASRT